MSLFVGNLSSRTRGDELERVFRRFGQCDLMMKEGYGFVVYDHPPNAEKALRALSNGNICGEPLTLRWANNQRRKFNRFVEPDRSFKLQHGGELMRRGDAVGGKSGSNDQDYKMNFNHSDGISRRHGSTHMRDKDAMYRVDQAKSNMVKGHSGYRKGFLHKGSKFKPNLRDYDRWGNHFHDRLNEDDAEFESYEYRQDYDRKYGDRRHQIAYQRNSPASRSPRKDTDREDFGQSNLNGRLNGKYLVTYYRCGGSGHMLRNCPQENASPEKSSSFDHSSDDDMSRRGSGGSKPGRFRSKSCERSSEHSIPKGLLRNEANASDSKNRQRPISNGSSSLGNENDKSCEKTQKGNKRSRKGIGSPERHSTKKARGLFMSSLHSRSHSTSQSFGHVKRSSSHSRSRSLSSMAGPLSSQSRSHSSISQSQSKSSKYRARFGSPASLSPASDQSLPLSSNKAQLTLKGSLDNVTDPESKVNSVEQEKLVEGDDMLEEDKHKQRTVAANNENGVPIGTRKGQLERVENASLSLKNLGNKEFSLNSLMDRSFENSDKSMKECMPVKQKNPDSDPPFSHQLGISSDELCMVLKHYYGHDILNKNERQLPVDAYFGSARLWPWEVIYYRRLKKGPISVENYARRLDQNKEFGITDKYIRSSSGWEELAQK